MSKIKMGPKEIVVPNDETFLTDFEGNDALLQEPENLQISIQRYATATMPILYARALQLVQHSKNERTVLAAMDFIRKLSEGPLKARTIDAITKTMSDEDINKILDKAPKDIDAD